MIKLNKINKLIANLCPEGVEYFRLSEISSLYAGFSAAKGKWTENGNCQFIDYLNVFKNISVNVKDLKNATIDNFNKTTVKRGDVLFTAASETPNECAISSEIEDHISDGIFIDDHLFAIRFNQDFRDRLKIGYAKYVFRTEHFRAEVSKVVRGVTRFYVSKKDFMASTIPVPPLEIQDEIVRILDNFTELESELESELEFRNQQYEYYRNKLFDFSTKSNKVPYLSIGSFSKCFTGATPKTDVSEYWENGTIPWMSSGEVNDGEIFGTKNKITQLGYDNSSTKIVPHSSVLLALAGQGKTRGKVAISRIPLCTNQSLCSIITNKTVNPDYLYFFLQTQYFRLREISSGDGSRGGLNLKMIKDFLVPVPDIKTQENIVNKLRYFSKLNTSLSEGLPAEIKARKQQYEYYRNKLLTFEELK